MQKQNKNFNNYILFYKFFFDKNRKDNNRKMMNIIILQLIEN